MTQSTNSRLMGFTLALGGAFPLAAIISVMPVMPQVAAHYANLPGGTALTGLVLVAPPLAAALASPFIGRLVDHVGGRRALIASILTFAVFGGLAYVVEPLPQLVATRAMVGLGMAGLTASTGALFAALFDTKAREKWLAVQTLLMSFGSITFALLAGVLGQGDWRRVFFIVPLSLVLLPLALLARTGSVPSRQDHHAVSGQPFPFRKIFSIGIVNFCCLVLCFGQIHPIAFLIAERGFHSTTMTGFAIAMNSVGGATGSALFGLLPTSPVAMRLRLGLSMALMGYLVLFLPGWTGIFAGQFIVGGALGVLMPTSIMWAISSVAPDQGGRSAGMVATSTFLSQFVAMPLGAILASAMGRYALAMAVFGGAIALCLLLTLAIKPSRDAHSAA